MKYKTKQRQALLDYLRTVPGRHITVSDIRAHFARREKPIGMTTVYRQVEALVREGVLRKYVVDKNSAACFEYTGENPEERGALHCKCEHCGRLLHIPCGAFAELEQHLSGRHGFNLNPQRTVLYGRCEDCRPAENETE